ncbi:MAG: DUF6273 domain-containing protein [Saccharofermentans sp.]|nr:DUF6273 domain-containing protein [Saccharofermentans sp.]
MAVLKCKMCGGDLNIEEGMTVCECEYCNTKQTVPTLDDEKKVALFTRANRLRALCEFDKAYGIYESIVVDFPEEAEAYWGLILCKYGIEYVDDPATAKKIPTCHRSSFESVMEDSNFELVMEYSDSVSRGVYRDEAKKIEELRKRILEVSSKEEPYDIFICYKETDENGERTIDSVIAQDVYKELTNEGYRVFFSRITLEDKLGQEYEPYIFAALHSAKVMLAFGTDYEYFNAVWVKNEWSRYLQLIAKGEKKTLIPCYKGIDAYDMPKEFARLQAQDMGKVGAVQDLLRGIEKIIGSKKKEVVKETVVVQSGSSTSVDKMLERGHLALEDDDWGKADSFFEEALNQNPKCAEAYLGKLLVENKVDSIDAYFSKLEDKYSVDTEEKLIACDEETEHINAVVKENVLDGYLDSDKIKNLYVFDRTYTSSLVCRKEQKRIQLSDLESDKLLSRVRQYASGDLKNQIEAIVEKLLNVLDERIAEEQQRDEASIADVVSRYQLHVEEADKKVSLLRSGAEKKKQNDYEKCVVAIENATTIDEYEKVISEFKAFDDYEQTKENIEKCYAEIDRIKEEKRQEKERLARKIKRITIISIGAVIAAIIIIVKVVIPTNNYNKAISFKNNGQYSEAIAVFENLDGYKDSKQQIVECRYGIASELMNNGQYGDAISAFQKLDGYKDSKEQILGIVSSIEYISTLSVGESFYYGNYNDEPLEWTILDIQGDQVLAITTNAVDKRPYNNTRTDVTWETCSLRTWLNDDFYRDAFISEEQSRIMTTTVSPGRNYHYSTNVGNATEDRIFLLSINEVEQYFSRDESRKCEYDGNICWWWLRSPGRSQDNAADVSIDGSVYYGGFSVDRSYGVVRPALWINLES